MKNELSRVVSKVLVLDGDAASHDALRDFCRDNDLVAHTVPADRLDALLRAKVDLGAVLLWEGWGGSRGAALAVAREIHRLRPELPLFLRCADAACGDALDEADRRLFRACFSTARLDLLREAIGAALFTRVYPGALVRGITELTRAAIEGQFRHLAVSHEAPCLVRDRVIYGELFSLIPLESAWCRGYMMLQAAEAQVLDFVRRDSFGFPTDAADFREINNLLGETTNLVWGAFKNRFIQQAPDSSRLTQVPIIVNHLHRYISFGSEDPLLCVKYRLADRRDPQRGGIDLYQWFAFSLAWTPDKFEECLPSAQSLCAAGELELF